MKRTTVTIKIGARERDKPPTEHTIPAWVDERAPHMAITRPVALGKATPELLARQGWMVTHIKTGYTLTDRYHLLPTRAAAVAYAATLEPLADFDQDDPRAVHKSFSIPFGQAIARARAAAGIEN